MSFVAYMPYIAAQFFPRFYTLIPAGLAVGFGGGPLWCAKCTYLSVIAEAFSVIKKRKVKADYLIVKFFGLFFVFYQLAQVLGNLISFSGESFAEKERSIELAILSRNIYDHRFICFPNRVSSALLRRRR